MGLAVDRVIPYRTSFAMLACRGHASHPMPRWSDCVHLSAESMIVEAPDGLLLASKSYTAVSDYIA